jgi:hypothetical protein
MNQAKLSKLQKWILLAAYQKIEHLEPSNAYKYLPFDYSTEFKKPIGEFAKIHGTWLKERGPNRELSRHEILMRYFDLPEREPRGYPHKPIIDRRGRHQAFNSASASLSRAVTRLRQRGLVHSYFDISLTTDGIEVAKELKRLHGQQLSRM